jgi:CRISPR-associated protein Csd1
MILKALYDYYQRCGNLAPYGMDYKEIPFIIVIDYDGHFLRIEDRRIDNKNAQKFLVVKGMRAGTLPKPYIFWDNVEYVLNYSKANESLSDSDANDQKKIEERAEEIAKIEAKNIAFINKCKEISETFPNNQKFKAVCAFYENNGLESVQKDPLWNDILKKPTVNISFLIDGTDKITAEDDDLRLILSDENETFCEDETLPICLITGKRGESVELTSPTMIQGGQATGRIVAFQVNSGYDSYGKTKCFNAPISKPAEAAFTTALNSLLAKDSHNKFIIGNRTFVFWASSNSEASIQAEASFYNFLGFTENDDDPNRRIEEVKRTFNSIYSGSTITDSDDRFYILGLAPNAARIAVVYWNESPIKAFAAKILQHFKDMEIIDCRNDKKPYFGLHQILASVSLLGKSSNIQPNLPEAVIKSILQNTPYPYSLFIACLRRIRAESGSDFNINITRAAIIKAYLNRINNNNKKISIMIDKGNTNQGYLCGRLFATLQYIQNRSTNNDSIKERYLDAASTTPAAVFSTLLNLSAHHFIKLDEGAKVYLEKLESEIISKISANGFPSHLDIQDQGRFMVGYYHQRQEFFTKKEDKQE